MGWLSRLLGADDRNAELRAWGQSVPVSPAQAAAMRELWLALRAKNPPQADPLATLPGADREYILRICSADFRPREFGSADALRASCFRAAVRMGFSEEQAAVVVGMTFNDVGPIAP